MLSKGKKNFYIPLFHVERIGQGLKGLMTQL